MKFTSTNSVTVDVKAALPFCVRLDSKPRKEG